MSTRSKVFKYEVRNVLRGRAVLLFALCLLVLTEGLLWLGGGGTRAVVSLMNVVLYLVPLLSLVFGTMYLYGAREFMELLLAQPVDRGSLFAGVLAGLALPMAMAIAAGIGLPFLWHGGAGGGTAVVALLVVGVLLVGIFTALAVLIVLLFDDRAKGLGAAIVLWLVVAVLYDGALLAVIAAFRDYPIETPLLLLTLLNPIDLARVVLLLSIDVAALMGYTGAAFQRFFGNAWGIGIALVSLVLWAAIPLGLGARRFRRKDF